MSKTINCVHLLGHAGKDPEVKYTTGGTAVASFSLATTERYKDKSGEWQDKTSWHNVKAFGKTAEVVEKYVTKGKQVYLRGKIDYQSWEDKETGQKKYKTEIIVDELVLLGGGEKTESAYSNSAQTKPAVDDSDVPF